MGNAFAADASSASLSIAPKKNYQVEPGDSVKDTLVIRNLDRGSSLQLSLRVIDFTYTNDTGTPKLFTDPNAPQTTWSLRPYLTVPKTVTIAPGSSKTLNMKVAIPSDLGAGSYYSAIIYSTGAPGEGLLGLSASGVTLVFVNVPGLVHEKLTVEKFGAYSDRNGFEYFAVNEPQYMAYLLKNDGNVTESPVGSITISNIFGQKMSIDEINQNGALALRGQTRKFVSCIKEKVDDTVRTGAKDQNKVCVSPGMWPGLYTASIDLFYGQNGNNTQEIQKTVHFWYMPWWFIILVIVVILVAYVYIRKLVLKIRGRLYGPRTRKLPNRR
jgi:hypothetical protein